MRLYASSCSLMASGIPVFSSASGKVTRMTEYSGKTRLTKRSTSGIARNRSSKKRVSSSVRFSSAPRGSLVTIWM